MAYESAKEKGWREGEGVEEEREGVEEEREGVEEEREGVEEEREGCREGEGVEEEREGWREGEGGKGAEEENQGSRINFFCCSIFLLCTTAMLLLETKQVPQLCRNTF